MMTGLITWWWMDGPVHLLLPALIATLHHNYPIVTRSPSQPPPPPPRPPPTASPDIAPLLNCLQAKAKNRAVRATLEAQLAKIKREIRTLADLYTELGFATPAVGSIPVITASTLVALSLLVPVDAGQEADDAPPVQHSM